MKTAIYWIRNDLRVHDNVIFSTIAAEYDYLLPVYIYNPSIDDFNTFGFENVGSFRKNFLIESIQNLKRNLIFLGSDLIVIYGSPSRTISEIFYDIKADSILYTKEHTSYEIQEEKSLAEKVGNSALRTFEQISMVSPENLPFSIENLPITFTHFRKTVEDKVKPQKSLENPKELPSIPTINLSRYKIFNIAAKKIKTKKDNRSVFNFQGGESPALSRLNDYIWSRKLISNYKNTRNGMIGESYSSKFSPWLSNGALSPRKVYDEILKFEKIIEKNISTYWLKFELLWRDYFRFVAIKYGDAIFHQGGIKRARNNYENDFAKFEMWMTGETEDDFVNANMNELNHSGFMSNRGRQNVASYLIHDLNIDWTWGASYFESKLIDYDVCSNWCNWMYVAGVGNDPRPKRKFNTVFQAKKYDKDGSYRKLWKNSKEVELELN